MTNFEECIKIQNEIKKIIFEDNESEVRFLYYTSDGGSVSSISFLDSEEDFETQWEENIKEMKKKYGQHIESYPPFLFLDIYTIGKYHKQKFLLYKNGGFSQKTHKEMTRIEVLQDALEYIKNKKTEECSYTVEWVKNGDSKIWTSYFLGKNVGDVWKKIQSEFGDDKQEINILLIKLNPIS